MMTMSEEEFNRKTPQDEVGPEEDECRKSDTRDQTVKDYNTIIPDGGWGWFVVLGSFLSHVITGGFMRSTGVFYLRFYDKFGQSAVYTSWVIAIPAAIRLLLGIFWLSGWFVYLDTLLGNEGERIIKATVYMPLCGWELWPLCSALCQRFSCRKVVVGGSIFYALTMIVSAFATDLKYLLVSYSFIGGISTSFTYPPSVMMVAMYFNKKLSIATGIATSGTGIGALILPPFLEIVFDKYGFEGALIILAGLILNICICGFLFRPLALQRKLMAFDARKKEKSNIAENGYVAAEEKATFLSHNSLNIEIHVSQNDIDSVVHKRKTEIRPSVENNIDDKDDGDSEDDDSADADILHSNGVSKHISHEYEQSPCHHDNRKRSVLQKYIPCCKKSEDEGSKNSRKLLNISVLGDIRFLAFCVMLLLSIVASQSAFVFLPAYGRQIGASDMESAVLIVITGTCDGASRLLTGIILGIKCMRNHRVLVYNIIIYFIGVMYFVIPSTTSYPHLCVICAIYGLLIGATISQKSVIMVDVLGSEKIISAFGIATCFQGIGLLLGPPLSGLLKDISGTYDYAFYVGGIAMFVGAIIFTFGNILHAVRRRRKKKTDSS